MYDTVFRCAIKSTTMALMITFLLELKNTLQQTNMVIRRKILDPRQHKVNIICT